jgi:threonine/homoserine/homoserine lactone efflux protein
MTLAFLGATLALALLTIMPGPDVAIVTRVVLAHGKRAAFRTALGISTGLLFWGLLTVIGLAALLAASAEVYLVVKFAGAAYLIWLGIKTIWQSRHHADRHQTGRHHAAHEPAVVKPQRPHRPWLTGFINNLLNPKIAIFYTSLLPQLVPSGAPHALTLFSLVIVHAVLTVSWLTTYGYVINRSARFLQLPRVRRALDKLTGIVLIGFGIRVAIKS